MKVLRYDGQGFWLCHKRLSQGRFPWWPSASSDSKLPGVWPPTNWRCCCRRATRKRRGLPRTGVRSARGVDLVCMSSCRRTMPVFYFIDQHDRKMPARPYASGRCAHRFVPVVVGCQPHQRIIEVAPTQSSKTCAASRRGSRSSDAEDATPIRRVFRVVRLRDRTGGRQETPRFAGYMELLFGKPTEKTAAVLGASSRQARADACRWRCGSNGSCPAAKDER